MEQEEITQEQQSRLQQLAVRNERQDELIGAIGEGVDRLYDMSKAMGEEVGFKGFHV